MTTQPTIDPPTTTSLRRTGTANARTRRLVTACFSALERAFTNSLPVEGKLADVACGPALDGERFVGLGFNVVGIDLSAGMLAMAAERIPDRLAQADLRTLPIDTGCLDGIWCAASLLHTPEADTVAVLKELKRTLRHHGNGPAGKEVELATNLRPPGPRFAHRSDLYRKDAGQRVGKPWGTR